MKTADLILKLRERTGDSHLNFTLIKTRVLSGIVELSKNIVSECSAERKFKEISEAYQVLSDEVRRREYDEEIRSAPFGRAPPPRRNFSSPDEMPSFRARRNPNHRFTMLDPMDLFKSFFGADFGSTFFKSDPFFSDIRESFNPQGSSSRFPTRDPFDDPFFRDPFMSSFREVESQLQARVVKIYRPCDGHKSHSVIIQRKSRFHTK